MSLNRHLLLALSLLSFAVNVIASSTTPLEDLQLAGKLKIKTWIEPDDNILANQQLSLKIEIATDNWFSAGTGIGAFEVTGALVLQREKFAVNSTRQEDGISWTLQQWSIEIYPQRAGRFEIPPIPLQLSIAGDNQASIEGQTLTSPLSFEVTIPETMQDKLAWVATNLLEVEESYNQPIENLKVGDALVRTIHLSADNVPAMMLPTIKASQKPGMAAYQKPAQVIDRVNRGYFLAERIETITYLFERPGEYQIPVETFHWWNLETGSAETITLPDQTITITTTNGLASGVKAKSQQSLQKRFTGFLPTLYRAVFTLGVILLTLWLVRRWQIFRRSKSEKPSPPITESQLLKEMKKACRKNNDIKVLNIFFRWYDDYAYQTVGVSVRIWLKTLGDNELTTSYEQIMKASYSNNKKNNTHLYEVFMRIISSIKRQQQQTQPARWAVKMKLN